MVSFPSRYVLGTRGSELALTQARLTRAALCRAGLANESIEERIIATTGDKRQDLNLAAHDLDKAVFTKELEDALAAREIRAAVHSLKDVPTLLDDAFVLAAVLPRAPIEDVLITRDPAHARLGLDSLPDGSVVATSSVRRARQIRHLRPALRLVDIRGNVPTRLRKVAREAPIDATILARAGLERLGFEITAGTLQVTCGEASCLVGTAVLPLDVMLPSAGQGAVALEIRRDDEESRELLQMINHTPTWERILVERAFLKALGAGCQTPVGIVTECDEGNRRMRVRALVFGEEEVPPRRAAVEGSWGEAEALAGRLIAELKSDV